METDDPVWVKNSQGTERKMHINEGERMFGYGTGVTTAFRQQQPRTVVVRRAMGGI